MVTSWGERREKSTNADVAFSDVVSGVAVTSYSCRITSLCFLPSLKKITTLSPIKEQRGRFCWGTFLLKEVCWDSRFSFYRKNNPFDSLTFGRVEKQEEFFLQNQGLQRYFSFHFPIEWFGDYYVKLILFGHCGFNLFRPDRFIVLQIFLDLCQLSIVGSNLLYL